MTEYIKAENLTFEYIRPDGSAKRALTEINLSIEKGSFTAVIGHNGSGKSTLAKHINALLVPVSGRVFVDGMDTSEPDNLWKIRSRVAMVFQNPDNQIVSAIVEDDIAFGPENLGVEPDEIRQRVAFALEAVEMEEYREKAPHLLSGGQKQRIAIAGAVAMQPECIVFDEPTSMLDPRGRSEVLKTIERLKEMGITVILITHFMEEAALADRIFVMDQKHLVASGTPREIFRDIGAMKKRGLAVPMAAEIAYRLQQKGVRIDESIINTEDLVRALCQ